MTTHAAAPAAETTRWSADRLTRLSFLMIPVAVLWAVAVAFFGSLVIMPLLDLAEGDLLLMAGGAAGWIAQITMSVLLVAPAVAGLVAAIKALRRGGRAVTWIPLVLYVLAILQVAFSFVDAIHMTYYPQGGWLFW